MSTTGIVARGKRRQRQEQSSAPSRASRLGCPHFRLLTRRVKIIRFLYPLNVKYLLVIQKA